VFDHTIDNELDSLELQVIGISDEETHEVLKVVNLESEISLEDISANDYPYITLKFLSKDSELNSPAQLGFWRILYEGLPDFALSTNQNFRFEKDTLQQGEDLAVSFNVEALNYYQSDSVFIDILIVDEKNQSLSFKEPITFNDANLTTFEFRYNTSELSGKYKFSVNLNSDAEVKEKTYFNNFGVREFIVVKDILNPILDVSFDGDKILDGDLISSKPVINILLRDENPYLLLDDPSIIQIALISPSNIEEEINVNDTRLTFKPATNSNKNEAMLEFRPELLEDGLYKLIVQATDISKNISGNLNFERSFEVVNDQLISNVLNYPNPFSTSTEFVFTLTGNQIPDELKIQIMTVTGKIVKEIFMEELGSLKVGINRTTYRYDGTDDFGNKLANGVYLFKVVAKVNGESINKYEIESISNQFKNNLGKMVILR
jgi:hypothetical protein